MSGKAVGSVLKLFISKSGTSKRFDRESLTLDKDGVTEDKFYGKNTERSVLIASMSSYDLIKTYGIEMPFGYLGENILMDYNPYSLDVGTRLKIGDTILEISQHCTICNHLAVLDVKIPTLLKNDRGIFAKVISGGDIKTDEKVYIV
ncbi:MAG: MOSC domain-containing protein [Sulfurimonas sp.]|uniref:MOSC domain-containing protein n=1 Tax=Sulfurimonas sp. TaxID=2022749 RepID=UPI00262F66E3|nr:MOSC domain-containing protein [Sulfurimonas sp.]MCW8896239.1 MOSC domain-containing protein [Sulfurimonas sp.]MCW8953427.1 MOSC domain-containing protein [Sulfurimonas sp.]MCW9068466.1 MOSC domain-containing protein [Sulfurimonas sp.]